MPKLIYIYIGALKVKRHSKSQIHIIKLKALRILWVFNLIKTLQIKFKFFKFGQLSFSWLAEVGYAGS